MNTKRNKTGGREKGTPNRLTGEARQIFKEVMEGEIAAIKSALDEVREKDVAKYLEDDWVFGHPHAIQFGK